jgi:hypothetical protein
MARTNIADATDLTIADVLHKRFDALPAQATVAEVRNGSPSARIGAWRSSPTRAGTRGR